MKDAGISDSQRFTSDAVDEYMNNPANVPFVFPRVNLEDMLIKPESCHGQKRLAYIARHCNLPVYYNGSRIKDWLVNNAEVIRNAAIRINAEPSKALADPDGSRELHSDDTDDRLRAELFLRAVRELDWRNEIIDTAIAYAVKLDVPQKEVLPSTNQKGFRRRFGGGFKFRSISGGYIETQPKSATGSDSEMEVPSIVISRVISNTPTIVSVESPLDRIASQGEVIFDRAGSQRRSEVPLNWPLVNYPQ